MAENRKISKAMFAHPVWVDGLGMVDRIDTTVDPETGLLRTTGVTMLWLADERLLRVTTRAGETLLAVAASMKQLFDPLTKPKTK